MKFLNIILKNFKLLLRNKSSAFILFLGPILIIVIVGFFFSGKNAYELSIGYYSPGKTNLTSQFIESLEKSDYKLYSFSSEQSCVEKIKEGIIHTCIIFPSNFAIKNSNSNELRFIVDYSRINLVYKIIDSVSQVINVESKEVSYSLTSILLSNTNSTIEDLSLFESQSGALLSIEKNLSLVMKSSSESLDKMSFEKEKISSNNLEISINNSNMSFFQFKSKVSDLYSFSEQLFDEVGGFVDSNRSDELRESLDSINASLDEANNDTIKDFIRVYYDLKRLDDSLQALNLNIEKNKQLSQAARKRLSDATSLSSSIEADASSLISGLQQSRSALESISVRRAESIVSPVNTRIEPLVAESSNLQFTFPFLVVLIVMFASLMVASTLVIFEKNSRALFRNFLAPVSEKMFVLASFSTVIIITLIQAIIVLLIVKTGFRFDLLSNFLSVLAILFVAAVFFTVCGMLIGYLFSSQEGAVMASLVLGCVFLFISNLVVPLESIAPSLLAVIKNNPFVIFSDLLRKALLFKMPISDSALTLGILLWISLSILVLILAGKGFFTRNKSKKSTFSSNGKN